MTNQPVQPDSAAVPLCHLCGVGTVTMIPAFERLMRVSSDHFIWPRGGRLGVCDRCGGVQKLIDETWRNEIASIYENYRIYHQSGGVEQATFDRAQGAAATRSARLLKRFMAEFPPAGSGRLLDVGCGNGALLRAFAAVAPGWSLSGYGVGCEVPGRHRVDPGCREALHGRARRHPRPVRSMTMVHVLEHIPAPTRCFSRSSRQAATGGLLLVQLPDHRQNPFELAIATTQATLHRRPSAPSWRRRDTRS